MGKINFVKEPAYTYNLLWLFALYFNKDYFMKPSIGYKNSEEDIEYLQKMLEKYAPISDDILLFFYMPSNGVSFMTQYFFVHYRKKFIDGRYHLDEILNALNDHEQVIWNILKYYFPNTPEDILQECRMSMKSMNRLIKESDYSAEIKNALYVFTIDPISVIQKLSCELVAKQLILANQYEKQYKQIVELQQNLTYEKIVSDLKKDYQLNRDLSQFDEIYVSVGIITRQMIYSCFYDNIAVLIIGLDYEDFVKQLWIKDLNIELDVFGTVVSEKNRIEILELILSKEEMTQKEIGKELGLSANNVYYHLMLMIKANMLLTRNQGRTMLYRINKEYFEAVSKTLNRYSQ